MPSPSNEMDRELQMLESELKRLEAEYNMYFGGRMPRPPWETHKQVETLIKRLDRAHIANYGDRFRFASLQTRFTKFVELWDRGLRAKEEGRPGPFAYGKTTEGPARPARPRERVVHTTSFSDPVREVDKLRDLYHNLADARREAGQDNIPFHKFADLVRSQVTKLKQKGSSEVAFKVSVKDGKVAFTARGSRRE
ncbi:MAG: MXAN_5187 C-terminal domain-containing protein [Vicinamibacterales bacterium]